MRANRIDLEKVRTGVCFAPRGRAAARPYVRLKACLIGEVKVLFRHTLSGL